MPQFSKWHRMPCRVVADHTHGMGAALCLMRLFPDPAKADELAAWLDGSALAQLNKAPGIVGSCAASVDLDADGRLASAFGQTLDPDQNVEWAVVVEGNEPEQTTFRRILAAPWGARSSVWRAFSTGFPRTRSATPLSFWGERLANLSTARASIRRHFSAAERFSTRPEWARKVRVGENSPSLCPTMFSVT